jgi:hypothetical protein
MALAARDAAAGLFAGTCERCRPGSCCDAALLRRLVILAAFALVFLAMELSAISRRLAGNHPNRIVHLSLLAMLAEPRADLIIGPMFLVSRKELIL